MEQVPEHFTAPVCQALTTPMLIAGVPRGFFILNCTLTLGGVIAFHWLWLLLIGGGLYALLRAVTAYDPHWVQVVARAVTYHSYYEA